MVSGSEWRRSGAFELRGRYVNNIYIYARLSAPLGHVRRAPHNSAITSVLHWAKSCSKIPSPRKPLTCRPSMSPILHLGNIVLFGGFGWEVKNLSQINKLSRECRDVFQENSICLFLQSHIITEMKNRKVDERCRAHSLKPQRAVWLKAFSL